MAEALVGLDELSAAAGVDRGRVQWLLQRVHAAPTVAVGESPGRGHRNLWPADYAYLVRALDRLAAMQCPRLWLTAVAEWWRNVDAAAVAGARYLVVSPSRERAPVFVTSRRNVGDILAGCHGWIVDLLDQQTYR